MKSRILGLGLLAALLAGCGGGEAAFGVEDDRFVNTMVELRRAALETGMDTAAFAAARRRILETHEVTEDSLRSYVERRSTDLDAMAAIWDSVNARLSEETVK
jgi:hypothetical protein